MRIALPSPASRTHSPASAKSAGFPGRLTPRLAACALLLSPSRTTDSPASAEPAGLLGRLMPRLAACALLSLLAIGAALAQDQTGGIEGVVVDAASRQPVRNATVSLFFTDVVRGRAHNQGPQTAITDSARRVRFHQPSRRTISSHGHTPGLPASARGPVHEDRAGSCGPNRRGVTVELVPGATVTGHVVDEDGDPLNGCSIQAHPANNSNQTVAMTRGPMDREDGSYRLYNVAPGKVVITAECRAPAFEPRPLSEGPDPPPRAAYPLQFYPASSDIKSAQIVELSPGAENRESTSRCALCR